MRDTTSIRLEMIAACLKMNATGLNIGMAGNLSVRVDGGFLVTPTGIDYEAMKPEQIVAMDFADRYYGDFYPTSEWRFHSAILGARPDANVVLHSHALHCAILASCRMDIPALHYGIAGAGGDVIKCSGYAPFGTPQLSAEALEALGPRNACLLANHGVIALGTTIAKTLQLLQEIEFLAHHYIGTLLLGKGVPLTKAEMNVVLERYKTYGKQPGEARPSDAADDCQVTPPQRGGDRLP
ncbi:MAG TPA: class II aldolase/adducin family protein [Rhizomicrobium sp.]|nr:class II aldolase/adducin family protein [Rhizomicrobium sp.]